MPGRLALVALAIAGTVSAQAPVRRATNLAAVRAYPGFYHARPILVVGQVARLGGDLRISDDEGAIRVIFDGIAPEGLDEVRGELWDLGHMNPDDSRLRAYDLQAVFGIDPAGPWPRPGQVLAILAAEISPAPTPPAATIRSIVLNPARYAGQQVTIAGQFSGRNLLGELPDAPGRSRWDFVLRSADAAIWVTGIRPRGKDEGEEFELSVDARIDTARWLQVSGIVQQSRGLLWIDAAQGALAAAAPTDDAGPDEPEIRVPAAPPPEVMFSAPIEGETDVSMGANVRIQFTRDLDPDTLQGRVRVRYLEVESAERGEPATPAVAFTSEYSAAGRVLTLTFATRLERFRTVKVELLEGIAGADGQRLQPWTLTFAVGGS
ncbi:MAG: Ig-like domain-containing protein [Acidobacteria bacterium]|nr:Ig-like domain-containing protein [Acidobacteriota bacterium]